MGLENDVPDAQQILEKLQTEVVQLREALENRDIIGQAKGLLMATARLSEPEAFQLLVRQSQRDNKKLRDVAADLVNDHNARHDEDRPGG